MSKAVSASLVAICSVLATGYAAPAMAQDTQATTDEGAIIVTARRVEERLSDVPISITAFSQEQIANRNIVTAADLSTYTPSLETNNFFGTAKTEFSIRGFVQDIGTQPSVGVYFGDVVAPRAASVNVPVGDGAGPGSLFDLENIQVLKGPQGTLFGRNTTGGAVLLVPKKPTDKLEGYVEGSYGSYDMKRGQAVVNVPLSDTFKVRLGIDRMKRDGYLHNTGGIGPDRFNGVNYLALRGSVVANLTPDLENYTIVSYSRFNTRGDLMKLAACDPAIGFGALACAQMAKSAAAGDGFYTVQTTLPDSFQRTTQWQIINTTTWTASDSLTVKNIASYAQLKEDYSSEIFGTQFDTSLFVPAYPAGTYISLATVQPPPNLDTARQQTYTDEFRLEGQTPDKSLVWQAGIYGEVSSPLGGSGTASQSLQTCTDINAFVCNNPIGYAGGLRQLARFTYHDYGVYAQATYALTNQFKLTGGFRYTWDRANVDAQLYSFQFQPGPQQAPYVSKTCSEPGLTLPGCEVSYSQRSQKPTWLIDLDYKPTPDMLLYAKYSRGYRAGGVAPNVPANYATYQPEKLEAYEVGYKASWHGPFSGSLDLAAFWNDLSNQQLLVLFEPKPGVLLPPISGILNAGKSRIRGIEANLSLHPFSGFTLEGAYTYLDTKLSSIAITEAAADSPYIVAPSEMPGDQLPLSPKNKFTVTGTYTLPLPASAGELSIGATFVHVDKMVSNYSTRNADGSLGPFTTVPARELLNLNLNWNKVAGTPVDLALFATNVTNKHYYTFFAPLLGSTGFTSGAVGEPRMYGVRLRYTFGS